MINERSPPLPLITFHDVGLVLMSAVVAPIAWLLPERSWRFFSLGLAALAMALYPRRTRTRMRHWRLATRDYPDLLSPAREMLHTLADLLEHHFQCWRELRPGRWNPEILLHGRDQVDAALRAGRGAVLWMARFSFSYLVAKKALWQAGYPIVHLSRDYHGFAISRFGFAVLNRLRTATENRYLAERFVMPTGGEMVYTRKVMQRLRENRLVSITAATDAVKTMRPRVLGGRMTLATGPASLALDTGAALLPVVVVRTGVRRFEVSVGPALRPKPDDTRAQKVETLVSDFAKVIESHLLKYPRTLRSLNDISPGEVSA